MKARANRKAHGGFRSRIDEPQTLQTRHRVSDQLSQFDRQFRGHAIAGARSRRLLDRLQNVPMRMPQNQGTIREHVIDIAVAIDIEQKRTFARR